MNNIKILDVRTPSQKQKQSGIEGTVNLGIVDTDGTVIVRLSGITMRRSKAGALFLSEPSYSVGTGAETKWWKHFNLYPITSDSDGDSQKSKKSTLTDEIVSILESGGTTSSDTQSNNTVSSSSS